MDFLPQIPLLRLLVPLVTGILLAIALQCPVPGAQLWLFCLFALLLGIYSWERWRKHLPRWLRGLLIYPIFFAIGYLVTLIRVERLSPDHYEHHVLPEEWVVGTISHPPAEKAKSVKVVVEVLARQDSNAKFSAVSGKALLYLAKDSGAMQLRYGDTLLVQQRFQEVPSPANPDQFNYRRFLSFEQIHHQCFVPATSWHLLGRNGGEWWFRNAYLARSNLLDRFAQLGIEGPELAVLSALILGEKDGLDPETVRAYSSAGAMHVLAVSGLHVGIVFLVLNFLLKGLLNLPYGQALRAILLIFSLWCYAFLTGLSPSVMRAATMLSFVIFGYLLGRKAIIYNTLGASAIFLLILNPFLIMKVGFQLSYLAVLGIVFLHPRIYSLLDFQRRLPDQIWNITAVSMAAQIATFPLGLLYFHQFPNYFLLSNLVVIPLATVIIYLGILVLVCSPIKWLAPWLALGLKYLVGWLNSFVFWMESLPNSLSEGITISIAETWMIYLTLLILAGFAVYRSGNWLLAGFVSLVLLLSVRGLQSLDHLHQREWTVYRINKHTAIDFVDGTRHVFLTDRTLLDDPGELLFQVQHHWWGIGLEEPVIATLDSLTGLEEKNLALSGGVLQFYDQKLALIGPEYSFEMDKSSVLEVDHVLVFGNPNLSLDGLVQHYRFSSVIIDSSNPPWKAKKWAKQLRAKDLQVWCMAEKGAFTEKWH